MLIHLSVDVGRLNVLDKIVIVNKHLAYLIFTDRRPIGFSSYRDVRELIYWFLEIHMRLVNDDITQKIYINMEDVA